MPSTVQNRFTTTYLQPYFHPEDAHAYPVSLAPNLNLPFGTVLGEQNGIVDVQDIHASAAITAGTYTIGDGTNTTGAINWNDSLSTIQTKLNSATPGPVTYNVSGGPLTTPTDLVFTRQGTGVQATLTVTPTGITGGTLSVTHPTVGTAGTVGQYTAYNVNNTDGSQIPKGFLMYAAVSDASGNITWGGDNTDFNRKYVLMYYRGIFLSTDLVGLDANAVSVLQGNYLQGGQLQGIIQFG